MTTPQSGTLPPLVTAAGPVAIDRHLIIVHRRGWQALEDWHAIARRVRRADPGIGVFIVSHDEPRDPLLAQAAQKPSLVVSPGPLESFPIRRGRVYQGRQLGKAQQLRRLAAAGLPVPTTAVLTPDFVADPRMLGPLVVVKPTDVGTSSRGSGIQLMRTERVRYIAPEDYPDGHPGRLGPMLVQRFVDTGSSVAAYRVLTLFGDPLYCQLSELAVPRVPLDADDAALESASIAIQAGSALRRRSFVYHADVVWLARKVHAALPEIPLKGIDILREAGTGRLFVLETNPGGNTWHFSSDFLAATRAAEPPELAQQRLSQLDAFGTAALALARLTRAEAE